MNLASACVSYDHVLQLESCIAETMCQQFQTDGIVYPSVIKKVLQGH